MHVSQDSALCGAVWTSADRAFGACSDLWGEEEGAEHLPQKLLRELCPSLVLETSSIIEKKKPEKDTK